jgi:CelD/BcsL family acetyltransferase involved in cellulose biosynthesis
VLTLKESTGKLVALFPLCTVTKAGFRIARFIGLTHNNFNIGIFARNADDLLTDFNLREAFKAAALATGTDVYFLHNQPHSWEGYANPLRNFGGFPSPSFAYSANLPETSEVFFKEHYTTGAQRKRLRNKQSILSRQGNFVFTQAETSQERLAFLRAFYQHKKKWFLKRGLKNTFEPACIQRFFESVAMNTLELYGLKDGARLASVFGVMVHGKRMSALFTSINGEEIGRGSPGELLLLYLMMHCCDRGLSSFDLGVGEAGYKDSFCPIMEPLFDAAFPVSLKGRMAAMVWTRWQKFKRFAKHKPRLLHVLQQLRGIFG